MDRFKAIIKDSYLFHIHTNYTDGHLSCEDYFEFAENNRIKTIIFTEHVRQNLTYDFSQFTEEIHTISKKYPQIDYKIGVEAKILPGGTLDIDKSILPYIEIICFACHGFPHDVDLYNESFITLFKDTEWKQFSRIWVHPGRFLKKNGLLDNNIKLLKNLIHTAANEGVLIENNMRDNLPPESIVITNTPHLTGYDIHTAEHLKRYINKV